MKSKTSLGGWIYIVFLVVVFSVGLVNADNILSEQRIRYADLIIDKLILNSTSFTVGDVVMGDVVMKNIGNFPSHRPSEIGLNITYPDGSTYNFGVIGINRGLGINETFSGSNGFVPDKSGFYNLTFIVDPNNKVRESNEFNNAKSVVIKVSEERKIGLPDLTVLKSIKITPQEPNISDTVELTATIKNIGNATIDEVPIGIKWQTITPSQKLINDTYGVIRIGGLSPGENFTVRTKLVAEEFGEYHTNLTVDYLNTINESNESNNYREFVFNVGKINHTVSTPDLIISDIIVPSHLIKGERFTISASVKNIGNAPAGFNGTWKLWKADFEGSIQLFEGFTKEVIAPNQTIPFTLNNSYSKAGNHTLKISADPDNVIRERINETNNNVSIKLVVLNESGGGGELLPDLVIKNLSITPLNPIAKGNLTLNFTIQNQGNNSVNSSIFLPIIFSANITKPSGLQVKFKSSLPPGIVLEPLDMYYLAINTMPLLPDMINESGNYSVIAYIDPFNSINESNENNNLFNYSFYVAPYHSNISGADLIIEDVFGMIFVDIINGTKSYEISGNVKNIGNKEASYPLTWFYLEANFGDSSPPSYPEGIDRSIQPGEEIHFNITHRYGDVSGDFLVTLKADPFDTIVEANENNNIYSTKIRI